MVLVIEEGHGYTAFILEDGRGNEVKRVHADQEFSWADHYTFFRGSFITDCTYREAY